jgi:sigma-54 dependent transcriptional regulator, acetoin dehydrogenase operon transcriptional activator AcoR
LFALGARVHTRCVPRSDLGLRDALRGFLTGGVVVRPVRPEIVESWRRAALVGLQPESFDPPYDPDVDEGSRLERAAAPVLDQLSDDLAGTETSLLLTDERGHVVDRRVSDPGLRARLDAILLAPGFFYSEESAGTNGIGSALAQRAPAFVTGGEHFADALTDMACAGVPITDHRTGQMAGIIDITTSVARANSLMLPFAKQTAWEIEQRLFDGTSAVERVMHETFQSARRRAKGPLVLVSEFTMMTNPAAARLLEPADQRLLWDWSSRATTDGGNRAADLSLTNGNAVLAQCEPIDDGNAVIGALIWLRDSASSVSGLEDQVSGADRPTSGWSSLTESERSVADLVAEGLTNREVGTRLFLSHHTVDAHLRHIYRKLGVRSRVELTRVVAEQGP